jgi:hypothetical protein
MEGGFRAVIYLLFGSLLHFLYWKNPVQVRACFKFPCRFFRTEFAEHANALSDISNLADSVCQIKLESLHTLFTFHVSRFTKPCQHLFSEI